MNTERLLLNLFQRDYLKNKEYSYISQLAIITLKSLLPMKYEEGSRVDYKRYIEEYKLWLNYRNGDNSSLLNAQGRVISQIYWEEKDDSIISRIIPLILANKDYRIIEEEIIKNILFTTGNFQALFEGLSIGNLIYIVVNNSSSLNKEEIINVLKENIIGFSQKEYIEKYKSYYRVNTENYNGNFKVQFETEKLKLLNTFHTLDNNQYPYLIDCLNVIDGNKGNTIIGEILYDYLYSKNIDYQISKFHLSLGQYIVKLRKSRIDPEKLIIKEYILPDVFSFEEGEVFFHSLLKEAKVIKKEVKDNSLTSLIQTKTGMYLFKR